MLSGNRKPLEESRIQRKKRAVQSRLIQEAEKLMRQQPVETVTIQQITHAADVGHGTFYLHFSSKHDVLLRIVQGIAADIDDKLQQYFVDHDDPGFIVCQSARLVGRAALADPLWRWLIEHSGLPIEDMRHAIGRFATRDFGKGLMNERFKVPEIKTSSAVILGGFANGLQAAFGTQDPELAIDQTVELLLRLLGIAADEAANLAHQPLPDLDMLQSG